MPVEDHIIVSELAVYGFHPTKLQCELIRKHISLLLRWNEKISLTSIVDPLEILRFHFGESLFAVSKVPIQKGRLADVGSGAGFPGLAIALAVPSLSVTLIESNGKKAAFLNEVVRELKLERVEVLRERMESITRGQFLFDFVAARALGSHDSLLQWSSRVLSSAGKLVLWLGEEELIRITRFPAFHWEDPLQIPGSKKRFILIGSPM